MYLSNRQKKETERKEKREGEREKDNEGKRVPGDSSRGKFLGIQGKREFQKGHW